MNKTYEIATLQDSELENVVGGLRRRDTGAGFFKGLFAPFSGFREGMDCRDDLEFTDNAAVGNKEIIGNATGIALIIGTYECVKRGITRNRRKHEHDHNHNHKH